MRWPPLLSRIRPSMLQEHPRAEDYDPGTYRAVYTVNFPSVVYLLHVFRKRARRGIATPRQEIELVRSCYKLAQDHYHTIERHECTSTSKCTWTSCSRRIQPGCE